VVSFDLDCSSPYGSPWISSFCEQIFMGFLRPDVFLCVLLFFSVRSVVKRLTLTLGLLFSVPPRRRLF
jgi:hypothetical protein